MAVIQTWLNGWDLLSRATLSPLDISTRSLEGHDGWCNKVFTPARCHSHYKIKLYFFTNCKVYANLLWWNIIIYVFKLTCRIHQVKPFLGALANSWNFLSRITFKAQWSHYKINFIFVTNCRMITDLIFTNTNITIIYYILFDVQLILKLRCRMTHTPLQTTTYSSTWTRVDFTVTGTQILTRTIISTCVWKQIKLLEYDGVG